MRRVSDTIGSGISDKTLHTIERGNEIKDRVTDRMNEYKPSLEALFEKYKSTFESHQHADKRLFKAFPSLTNGKQKLSSDIFREYRDEIRQYFDSLKKK